MQYLLTKIKHPTSVDAVNQIELTEEEFKILLYAVCPEEIVETDYAEYISMDFVETEKQFTALHNKLKELL